MSVVMAAFDEVIVVMTVNVRPALLPVLMSLSCRRGLRLHLTLAGLLCVIMGLATGLGLRYLLTPFTSVLIFNT